MKNCIEIEGQKIHIIELNFSALNVTISRNRTIDDLQKYLQENGDSIIDSNDPNTFFYKSRIKSFKFGKHKLYDIDYQSFGNFTKYFGINFDSGSKNRDREFLSNKQLQIFRKKKRSTRSKLVRKIPIPSIFYILNDKWIVFMNWLKGIKAVNTQTLKKYEIHFPDYISQLCFVSIDILSVVSANKIYFAHVQNQEIFHSFKVEFNIQRCLHIDTPKQQKILYLIV